MPENLTSSLESSEKHPIFYIVRHQSASDLLALRHACKNMALPDPLSKLEIDGHKYHRLFCIDRPTPVLPWHSARKTRACEQGLEILKLHLADTSLDAQLIPVNITWGRRPTKEKNNANIANVIADQESPSWLRKFFIVLFAGRHNLIRFSDALSIRYMADNHGNDEKAAHKLLRVARFHFHRQTVAATGPRLMHRKQMFKALFANPAIRRLIDDEVAKGQDRDKVKKQALKIMDEIAGDYRDSMIRVGERVLSWLWNRLYRGIEVNNVKALHQLAQDGHEIIYVPCHRSHMDYLLLTYVIYQQGLVTPRIAAGINLSFWPAGPIFRKAGAFFIRRSFRGNRLYSTIFREYLSLLFERGYSVKYYTEGGRSRTGKVLNPKTGMLAMTIQSLLRGINRPLTLVPVYIGYEHVMEVATYHNELSGSKKQKESIAGVIKAIKSLRNYGKGYVNFGNPINLNQFLNQQQPDWKDAIDAIDPQKPHWLTPTVNRLADEVMVGINYSAALNGTALVALVLLASEHDALTKTELAAQLDFLLSLQRAAPYSDKLTLPTQTGEELLTEVISLEKVTVDKDSYGEVISLSESGALDMSYYRNNILHTFVLPALVCKFLTTENKIADIELVDKLTQLMALIKQELFLWQSEQAISDQVSQTLAHFEQQGIAKHTKAGFWSLVEHHPLQTKVHLLASCIDETLQRFAILTSLVLQHQPISKADLEQESLIIAKRILLINNENTPEFVDKKAQASLIVAMKANGLIDYNDNGDLIASDNTAAFHQLITGLINIEILQTLVMAH